MTYQELKERRKTQGAFAWYMQCTRHNAPPADFAACMSCDMVAEHNWQIRQEIVAEMGWLLDEPAGDVPLVKA